MSCDYAVVVRRTCVCATFIHLVLVSYISWQHESVVRMLVFGWWTFPVLHIDIWLTGDHLVGKLFTVG